jgi:SAM-dependent methyltransferase
MLNEGHDLRAPLTAMPIEKTRLNLDGGKAIEEFALYFDKTLSQPTPYHAGGDYFLKARDRMDRSFDLIKEEVPQSSVLDLGASPFYLLYRAKALGARSCDGIYFSNDEHPLRGINTIYSRHGPIELSHANIETEDLPFSDSSFDIITACEVLEHLEYFPIRLAREVCRVLRPGGLLLITVPNVCSIANILRLILQKNIYMKYRSDPTGRHKHEYTLSELISFIRFLRMEIIETGFLPAPTSEKFWLRPAYRAIARTPGLRRYSPVLYIVARLRNPKPSGELGPPPKILYDDALSIEE